MPQVDDRIRIAIDTNVLVAALTNSSGAAARIVDAWVEDRLEVVSSEATLREAELILDSRWLRRLVPSDMIEALLDLLVEAMGLPAHEDRFQHYRGMPGVQQVFEAARDLMQENAIDPAEVERAFPGLFQR